MSRYFVEAPYLDMTLDFFFFFMSSTPSNLIVERQFQIKKKNFKLLRRRLGEYEGCYTYRNLCFTKKKKLLYKSIEAADKSIEDLYCCLDVTLMILYNLFYDEDVFI